MAAPDAPRPDLDEADPLHVLSREAQTRAIAYTAASPKERHVLFGLLLADYDQQAAELDRLRAIETAAAAYVMAGLCGNPDTSAELRALIAAVRTNRSFRG